MIDRWNVNFRFFFWFLVFDYEYYVKCVCEYILFYFVLSFWNLYKKRMMRPTKVSFEICLCEEQHHHQHEGAFNFCFTSIFFCILLEVSCNTKRSNGFYCCVYQTCNSINSNQVVVLYASNTKKKIKLSNLNQCYNKKYGIKLWKIEVKKIYKKKLFELKVLIIMHWYFLCVWLSRCFYAFWLVWVVYRPEPYLVIIVVIRIHSPAMLHQAFNRLVHHQLILRLHT